MERLARIGVSIEAGLLKSFDQWVTRAGYPTRSEAVKGLVSAALVEKQWAKSDNKVAGAILFVYDHHKRQLVNKMLEVQHNFELVIISVQHIHLDHNNCLEIIAVRGKVKEIQTLMAGIKTIKGLKHSNLTITATG